MAQRFAERTLLRIMVIGVAGNLHFTANLACFVNDAYRRLFHRDVQSGIMFHAALSFLMLVAGSQTTFYHQLEAQHLQPIHRALSPADEAQAEYPISHPRIGYRTSHFRRGPFSV